MAERRDIIFRLLGDSKSLQRATRSGESALGGLTRTLKNVAGAAAIAFGAREIRRWAGDAVQLAAAAEEVDSKFNAVFGSAQELNDALREWGDLAGVTETDAKDLAATFGNLAMAQGLSSDATQTLTEDVAILAGDMASFNDVDPAIVFNDLNKALLTTEREGMKKYGIAITEAEVKTRAAEIAAADNRDEVTKADRALASYQIAVEQAGQAVGDLERTSDSTANRQRQLTATLKEQQEEIGRQLLPVYHDLISIATDLSPVMGAVADDLGDVTGAVSGLTGALSSATGEGGGGLIGFIRLASDAAKKLSPLHLGVDLFNDTLERFQGQEQPTRDAFGTLAGKATGLAGAQREAADAAGELNEQLQVQRDYIGELDAALSGDLFGKYRRLREIQGILGGGQYNPDYDRGENYTSSTSVYNTYNGIG